MRLIAQAGGGDGGVGFLLLASLAVAYFLPSIVGAARHVPNIGSVVVINVLLGWTVIGWIISLAMAARSVPPQRQKTDQAFQREGRWWAWRDNELMVYDDETKQWMTAKSRGLELPKGRA